MRQDWSNMLRPVLILGARLLLGSQSRLVDSRDLSGFIMLLFQAASGEEKSKTESQRVKKSTKSVDESSKKRKHSGEALVVPPAPGAGVLENPSVVVVPGPMLSLPDGFTLTRVDPEEPDHQDETPQVKYLGAFSDFLLTSSFFRCPSSSLTKGRWPRRIPTLRTKPLR